MLRGELRQGDVQRQAYRSARPGRRGVRWPSAAALTGGFTLVEVIVVVAIVGLLLGAVGVTLHSVTRSDLRSAARRTAGALRFAFDRAVTGGGTYRVAFDFEAREIRLEVTQDRVRLSGADAEDEDEDEDEEARRTAEDADGAEAPAALPGMAGDGDAAEGTMGGLLSGLIDTNKLLEDAQRDVEPLARRRPRFAPYKGLGAKKQALPGSVRIDAVFTPRQVQPQTEGVGYVHFFAQGHAEPAVIHLAQGDTDPYYYSVVLHPLTGRTQVFSCRYRPPEGFGLVDDALQGRGDEGFCEDVR